MRQSANDTTSGDPFFRAELAQWPVADANADTRPGDCTSEPMNLDQAEAYCRMWAKRQYENFTVVSFLLPRELRQDFYNVYAYCRWSDNLADEVGDRRESLKLLDRWQSMLLECFPTRTATSANHSQLDQIAVGTHTPSDVQHADIGDSLTKTNEAITHKAIPPVDLDDTQIKTKSIQHPVMIALQNTIEKHELEPQPFTDLLSAFRQDQTKLRYENDDELLEYCRRSANPVGRILLRLAKSDDAERRALSDAICTGLQIANFCQDMDRDARLGRIYMPRSRWSKHGVDERDILQGKPTGPMKQMLQEWVHDCHEFFRTGMPLVNEVPKWFACDLRLFIEGGRAILRAIERTDYDVWTKRPTVSKFAKLKLLANHLLSRTSPVQS